MTSTWGLTRKKVSTSASYFGVLGPPWMVMLCGALGLHQLAERRMFQADDQM